MSKSPVELASGAMGKSNSPKGFSLPSSLMGPRNLMSKTESLLTVVSSEPATTTMMAIRPTNNIPKEIKMPKMEAKSVLKKFIYIVSGSE